MEQGIISFIGGGNMCSSLVGGLIADGYAPERIRVSDPGEETLASLRARFGVHTTHDNREAAAGAGVVVLAVKPQVLPKVAAELAPVVQEHGTLVVSIAAGIRTTDLQRWLGAGVALVRTMPNTPALVKSGATALFATAAVTAAQRDQAESVLRAVGLTLWLENEEQMDAVTALSGSGPAYFFLVMEAMQGAAQAIGLPERTARLLTLQTAFGAAKMALESDEEPSLLRQRVTSPGGTTERALNVLEEGKLRELFRDALTSARDRSRELAAILGRDPD
ncbi:pyrroline-5-carboxylate reductase [Thioalbus denitrificans]|uniref:Pyrroline-5-carboxylate reductase n=1 Tax=Thioalbus denitrificans TaxID=547122 RepID=A0A369CC70_9GAMM|nr:pyrroline-5-carboxylate reductase [Thioalbus denitrificans]RCX30326.1 pyrroline-5-carboxylate reductase [Thioalbus denitrificans]